MPWKRGPMAAGDRDYLITLEQRPAADALDDSGAPTDDTAEVPWTTLVASMPAAKMDISGRERFTADQLSSPYDTRWEINYRSDMDPDLVDVPKRRRISYQGRYFDITAASMIGRREGIELLTLASSKRA